MPNSQEKGDEVLACSAAKIDPPRGPLGAPKAYKSDELSFPAAFSVPAR
jgi:hypothetical protein